ncbi:abscisic acid receptor PYR/PYL family [Vigna unguiculata]|uniref:Abscisic acid receptor PYR/PYL family n=1 Tax=Vigna unguiculata TaxID=3917 RepID=A0A4D6KYQ5_VIGUN|nr:abscisic acid receptor PYR/PYL family [Vigna unguiculata]
METDESSASTSEPDSDDNHRIPTNHHLNPPSGLTLHEFSSLVPFITEHHTYLVGAGQCPSLLAQRVQVPPEAVWSVVHSFDKSQTYKRFIKSCVVKDLFHSSKS